MDSAQILLFQLDVLQNISSPFIYSRRDTDSIFWSGGLLVFFLQNLWKEKLSQEFGG